jgi:uncharacterized membrane protein
MFKNFMESYENILHSIAEFTVSTLELVGILIIIAGSLMAIIKYATALKNRKKVNIFIALGRTFAFALEFKMGAEIVNTVIVRDLKELAVLGIVIVLRAVLAVLIHWEIKNERLEEQEKHKNSN